MAFSVATNNVGRMSATGALGVVHVNGTARDGLHCCLVKPRFVHRVGVQLDLEVQLVGNAETGVDESRRGPEVLVDLHAMTPEDSCSSMAAGRLAPPRLKRPKFIG